MYRRPPANTAWHSQSRPDLGSGLLSGFGGAGSARVCRLLPEALLWLSVAAVSACTMRRHLQDSRGTSLYGDTTKAMWVDNCSYCQSSK